MRTINDRAINSQIANWAEGFNITKFLAELDGVEAQRIKAQVQPSNRRLIGPPTLQLCTTPFTTYLANASENFRDTTRVDVPHNGVIYVNKPTTSNVVTKICTLGLTSVPER